MTLLEIIKKHNMKPGDIAIQLGINTGQIYQWNKKGILKSNPHYKKLKEILPEVIPKDTSIRKSDGQDDLRFNNKRPNKKLTLTESEIPSYVEPKFVSTINNEIYFKDTDGKPYVKVNNRNKTKEKELKEIAYKKAKEYFRNNTTKKERLLMLEQYSLKDYEERALKELVKEKTQP